jgi:hypothetical protein
MTSEQHRLKTTDYTEKAIVPYLRWAGFNETSQNDFSDRAGIPGDSGKFLAVWYVTVPFL